MIGVTLRACASAMLFAVVTLAPSPLGAQVSIQLNRLILVSGGGTPGANCNNLLAVLAGITDESETNRYLVRLEPGLFSCSQNVFVAPFVTLEGSGTQATRLIGSLPNNLVGLVNLWPNSELRHLSVQNRWAHGNSDPGASLIAVSAINSNVAARMTDVSVQGLSVDPSDATFGVKTLSATIEIWSSRISSESTGFAAATDGGKIVLHYSKIFQGNLFGNVMCRFSERLGIPLDTSCQ